MKRLALFLASCALAACATLPAEGDGVEASPDLIGGLDIAAMAPTPQPAVELPPPPALRAQPAQNTRRGREPTPLQTLAAANSAARQRPIADGFIAARHVYAYEAGAIYELYGNPNFISSILLEPGESITAIAAGDTSRWMVTETLAESETDPRTIVLVKPQTTGLRTNIVLATDRRTYVIEASAVSGENYSAQIAWSYPRTTQANGPHGLDRLNFDYRVRTMRGRTPLWTPTRVFDDGRRTWIEFAAQVAAADMPPIFVISGEGAELVNYRVQGQRYMIDRVFDRAELRLGARSPVIVRIDRQARTGARP